MKLGKVSDTILSRSVLKPLNTVRGQKVTRMDIGQDVSEVDIREQGVDKTLLSATACGYMPLIKAVNNIYAAGGTPIAASDCIVMPEHKGNPYKGSNRRTYKTGGGYRSANSRRAYNSQCFGQ